MLRAKWILEERLRSGPVPSTILRAGTIIGWGGYGFETLLKAVTRRAPATFYLGPGTQRDQPLWIGDMVRYLLAVRGAPWAFGRTFDCGGEMLTYARMVTELAELLGKPRPVIALPPALVKLTARAFDRLLPFSPALAAGAIDSRTGDTICAESSIRMFVPFTPLGFRDSVQRVLDERAGSPVEPARRGSARRSSPWQRPDPDQTRTSAAHG
jgi:uncharacterized protein YbjT (DUF2867 family)